MNKNKGLVLSIGVSSLVLQSFKQAKPLNLPFPNDCLLLNIAFDERAEICLQNFVKWTDFLKWMNTEDNNEKIRWGNNYVTGLIATIGLKLRRSV